MGKIKKFPTLPPKNAGGSSTSNTKNITGMTLKRHLSNIVQTQADVVDFLGKLQNSTEKRLSSFVKEIQQLKARQRRIEEKHKKDLTELCIFKKKPKIKLKSKKKSKHKKKKHHKVKLKPIITKLVIKTEKKDKDDG